MLSDRLRLGAGAAIVLVIGAVAGAAITGAVQPQPAVQLDIGESAETAELYVDVQGAVERPGIVVLPAGARVMDAIAAAGGLRDDAAEGAINLAREVQDGEQLIVPDEAGAEVAADDGLININQATAEELEELPGIGPSLSAAIVAYRDEHGPFSQIEQLDDVPGIGPAVLARLTSLVRL